MEILERIRSSIRRGAEDDRNTELQWAKRLHGSAKLSAAEEQKLQDAVQSGRINLERVEAIVGTYERLEALAARAAAADRRLRDRKLEFSDPTAEIQDLERKLPILRGRIHKISSAQQWVTSTRRELEEFVSAQRNVLGDIDISQAISQAARALD